MNKKGFTLIEIIISIAILSLIATIGIVTIKKTNEKHLEQQKEEYVERIKLETEVYRETQQVDKRFRLLKDAGDYVYIQIKDLISVGLLKEENENPFHGKKTNKEVDYDLIKVYLDDELNINIDYPTIYVGKTKEEIENIKENVFIHLKRNNENNVILPDTITLLNKIKEINQPLKSTFNKIKNNGYIYNGETLYEYDEPGYYLADYNGNEISTVDSDWCINKKWNNNSWTYTYEICENSDLRKLYNNIEDEDNKRTISAIDNSAPIIVDISNNDYLEYTNEPLNCYVKTSSTICNFNKYEEKNGKSSSNYYDYYIFDNFDIISDSNQFQEKFTTTLEETKTISDTSNNYKKYTVYKNAIKNNKPYISYENPSNGYYTIGNLTYTKSNNKYYLKQIIDKIFISDDIDTSYYSWSINNFENIKNTSAIGKNNISVQVNLKYVYNSMLTSKVNDISIFNATSETKPRYGRYTLSVKACDSFGECTTKDFSIAIREYQEQLIRPGNATGCDDTCIIEIMQANSIIWKKTTSKATQQNMTNLNNNYKDYLSNKDNIYSKNGIWCERESISSTGILFTKIGQPEKSSEFDTCVIGQMETNGQAYNNTTSSEKSQFSEANLILAGSLKEKDAYYIQVNNKRVWCERNSISSITRLLEYNDKNKDYKDACILVQMKINGKNYGNTSYQSQKQELRDANATLATTLSYGANVTLDTASGIWYRTVNGTKKELLANIVEENGAWHINI